MEPESAMLPTSALLEDLQKRLAALYAASPAKDFEANVKAVLHQGFAKLDLVTRADFELQQALLERAMTRVGELEARLQALEQRNNSPQ